MHLIASLANYPNGATVLFLGLEFMSFRGYNRFLPIDVIGELQILEVDPWKDPYFWHFFGTLHSLKDMLGSLENLGICYWEIIS